MRLKEVNYFGFNHSVVNEKFGGDLTYIRTFTIRGHYWAVYRAANPNRELGHKDYMMLCTHENGGNVSGSTPEQMEEERYQEGVLCSGCDTVLYSINRHHFHKCGCKLETFVDGGKDYLRRGGHDLQKQKIVKIDLITGEAVAIDDVPCVPRIKLDSYCSEKPDPDLKIKPKRAKPSHSGENKKRLTPRRKSGKIKEKQPRSKK